MSNLCWLPSWFAPSKKLLDESGFQISRLGLVLCIGSRSSSRGQGFQPLKRTSESEFQLFVVRCSSPKLSPSCSIGENGLNQTLSIVWLKFPNDFSDPKATGTPSQTPSVERLRLVDDHLPATDLTYPLPVAQSALTLRSTQLKPQREQE